FLGQVLQSQCLIVVLASEHRCRELRLQVEGEVDELGVEIDIRRGRFAKVAPIPENRAGPGKLPQLTSKLPEIKLVQAQKTAQRAPLLHVEDVLLIAPGYERHLRIPLARHRIKAAKLGLIPDVEKFVRKQAL